MRVFSSPAELIAATGSHLGYSDWHEVDQRRIDLFAEATGDDQWIHVDAERAAAGPFGGTIAHGFLMLSLLPLLTEAFTVEGARMGVNYGLNRVRFTAPVRSGTRVRVGAELLEATQKGDALQITVRATVEAEDSDRPCCVAEHLSRYYF